MSESKESNDIKKYDLIVIGGGSGGLGAARRAAEYGKKVIIFEPNRMGGTCVNVGCVPKKLMWEISTLGNSINHHSKYYGFTFNNLKFDMKSVKKRRDDYILKLNKIYERNVNNANIDLIREYAKFVNPKTVIANNIKYSSDCILIAVGGYPFIPDIPGKEFMWTSDDFFNKMDSVPKKTAVVGAGYIAVELGQVLQELGSSVSLFTRGKYPLRRFDRLISCGVTETLLKDGITLINNSNLESISKNKNNFLDIKTKEGNTYNNFDCIISAIGRGPSSDSLGLTNTKVKQDERDFIISDEWEETNEKGIYALGDINDKIALTPVAIRAGRKFSDRLFGNKKNSKMDYTNVPTVIFSHPPCGTIGLEEYKVRELVKNGKLNGPINVYESHFNNLRYGIMEDKIKKKTHMKLVCIGKEEKVVGLHMIGDGCDEMLQGFGVAIKMGATKSDFDSVTAIHPTGAEELVTMKKARGDLDNYKYDCN